MITEIGELHAINIQPQILLQLQRVNFLIFLLYECLKPLYLITETLDHQRVLFVNQVV